MKPGRLTRVLAVVGGASLVLVIGGGVILGFMIHHGFSARDEPSWVEVKLARAMRSWAVPSKARELRNPVPATPEVLSEARAHWADHCAGCHANDGSGDTPVGQHLYPKAPNMRSTATQALSDGELYYVIQNGIRMTGMPAWSERDGENDHETWALVRFIRHLPDLTTNEIEEMRRLNPKSPDEWREEQEEERFLRGEEEPHRKPETEHHHHQ